METRRSAELATSVNLQMKLGLKKCIKILDVYSILKQLHSLLWKLVLMVNKTKQKKDKILIEIIALFSSVLKDMKRDDKKIVDKDYIRYYFCMRWFLQYHLYENKTSKARKANTLCLPSRQDEGNILNKSFDFDLVATAFDLGTILFCIHYIRQKQEEKKWFEVTVTADCFRQMLVSLHEMSQSEEEEYRDAAEHIQSNVYYEQSILDLLHSLVKNYRNQSKQYLKTMVMLTHVLLKMLDHYAKTKKTLFVRKKKNERSRKKKDKKKQMVEGSEEQEEVQMDESEGSESEEDHGPAYNEQLFKFEGFEKVRCIYPSCMT